MISVRTMVSARGRAMSTSSARSLAASLGLLPSTKASVSVLLIFVDMNEVTPSRSSKDLPASSLILSTDTGWANDDRRNSALAPEWDASAASFSGPEGIRLERALLLDITSS